MDKRAWEVEMEAKHTEGPWTVEDAWKVDGTILVTTDDDVNIEIAQVNCEEVSYEQALADAHLIAAAPKLVEALRAVLEAHDFELEHGGQVYTDGEAIRALLEELGE